MKISLLQAITDAISDAKNTGEIMAMYAVLAPLTKQLEIVIKEEAMVMCTKNNFEAGYVNGTLARVILFDSDDGFPIIKTTEGVEIKMKPLTWNVSENEKVLAEISQVPLRLAWAITVHKSQGMVVDAEEIDRKKAFVYG